MNLILTPEEVRVLGALMEKEMATPEYYPLSLNALANACNQKSNREPVVSYEESTILAALGELRKKQLVWLSTSGRVSKFGENLIKPRNMINREAAVLCVLMLRGPQTPGEIRGRTERLHQFASMEEVEATLTNLTDTVYVEKLPRQPGHKESRYCHLFLGASVAFKDTAPGGDEMILPELSQNKDRIGLLEEQLASLRQEVEELRQAFLDFKGQFDS